MSVYKQLKLKDLNYGSLLLWNKAPLLEASSLPPIVNITPPRYLQPLCDYAALLVLGNFLSADKYAYLSAVDWLDFTTVARHRTRPLAYLWP